MTKLTSKDWQDANWPKNSSTNPDWGKPDHQSKGVHSMKDFEPSRLTIHERLEELQSYAMSVADRAASARKILFGETPETKSVVEAPPYGVKEAMENNILLTRTSLERIAADMDAIVNALYVR